MRGRYWQVIYRDKVTICDNNCNLDEKFEFIHKDEKCYHTHILFKFKEPVDLLKTFKAKNDVIDIVRVEKFDCWKRYLSQRVI